MKELRENIVEEGIVYPETQRNKSFNSREKSTLQLESKSEWSRGLGGVFRDKPETVDSMINILSLVLQSLEV